MKRLCRLLYLQEASELSSLKPQLDELGVPLYAVVKEKIGSEIQDFKPNFAGEIFLDETVGRLTILKLSISAFLIPESIPK